MVVQFLWETTWVCKIVVMGIIQVRMQDDIVIGNKTLFPLDISNGCKFTIEVEVKRVSKGLLV